MGRVRTYDKSSVTADVAGVGRGAGGEHSKGRDGGGEFHCYCFCLVVVEEVSLVFVGSLGRLLCLGMISLQQIRRHLYSSSGLS